MVVQPAGSLENAPVKIAEKRAIFVAKYRWEHCFHAVANINSNTREVYRNEEDTHVFEEYFFTKEEYSKKLHEKVRKQGGIIIDSEGKETIYERMDFIRKS